MTSEEVKKELRIVVDKLEMKYEHTTHNSRNGSISRFEEISDWVTDRKSESSKYKRKRKKHRKTMKGWLIRDSSPTEKFQYQKLNVAVHVDNQGITLEIIM